MQAFIDKFRFNAKRASLVQSRIKALERMADVEEVEVGPCTVGSGSATKAIAERMVGYYRIPQCLDTLCIALMDACLLV